MENGSPNFNNPEPRNSNARNINLSDNVFGPNDAQLEKKFKSLELDPLLLGNFPACYAWIVEKVYYSHS